MTRAGTSFDDEPQLLALPGSPPRWLWALTCRQPDCPCRSAIVLSAPGDRAAVLESGRLVVEAWQQGADYFVVARDLRGATVFAIDFDTGIAFKLGEDEPMPRPLPAEVQELTDRLDDDVLDAIARLWHRGKGQPSPPEPDLAASAILMERWRPGDRVAWHDLHPLRSDDYELDSERLFRACERYCVNAGCSCRKVVVEFQAVSPRGTPDPGRVELDGEQAILRSTSPRQQDRLTALWAAYRTRHLTYPERVARRSMIMHRLAGRIAAAPPAPSRNASCPCGSGKKYKLCCELPR